MFSKLEIVGYRGFKKFSIPKLGRINLFVGRNNCGKTSLLEAVQLAASFGNHHVLYDTAKRRGELGSRHDDHFSAGDIFYQYKANWPGDIQIDLGESTSVGISTYFGPVGAGTEANHEKADATFGLIVNWQAPSYNDEPQTVSRAFPFDNDDCIHIRKFISPLRHQSGGGIVLVSPGGQSLDEISKQFASVALEDEEDFLVESLRSIEPRIERIAPISHPRGAERGGFAVRIGGLGHRISLGSLGDGMWRVLGLALGLVTSRGSVILFDEIDTGLHYTTMEKMWRLIDETSKRLNVQVFATTHSRDCYESLASICREDVMEDESEIMVHRIEQGRDTAVSYSEGEIVSVSLYDTEVR